jgi:hypothetical protein
MLALMGASEELGQRGHQTEFCSMITTINQILVAPHGPQRKAVIQRVINTTGTQLLAAAAARDACSEHSSVQRSLSTVYNGAQGIAIAAQKVSLTLSSTEQTRLPSGAASEPSM